MTEKERREQGLPPSPALLEMHEHFQKEAEEHKRRAEEMLASVMGPAMSTISEFAERMQPTFSMLQTMAEPITRMQEHIASVTAHYKDFDDSMRIMSSAITMPTLSRELSVPIEPIRYVPEYERRPMKVTVELTEKHCEMIGNSVATALVERGVTIQVHHTSAQIDLVYDRKTRMLTRHVDAAEYSTHFDGKEDNKRRELFEKLVHAKRGVATDELKEYLDCPSIDATYKVIQGLNKKMADDLGLTMNIADGSDKGGYRIHSQIAIHEIA